MVLNRQANHARKMMLLEIIALLLVDAALSSKVSTTHGKVEGRTITLFNGKEVDAFLSIPYAAAPIGEYRFSSPQPLTPWTGTLQTKSLPRPCYQAATEKLKKVKWSVSETPETEDCLYLNIWVPKRKSSKEKLPIMIWLYPGAFKAGSSELYDGSILASEQNVIVASMNYRVSMLGFLFLNSSQVPGNMGLQDQIQAIRWIKGNADAFSGDADMITLFGQSAGSVSVGFHLTNMQIYDLFQRAIMESGPFDSPVVTLTKEVALENSYSLLESLNCSTTDEKEMLACVRAKKPEEILKDHLGIPKYYQLEYLPVRNGIEVPLTPSAVIEEIPPSKRKNLLSGTLPMELIFFIEAFANGKVLSKDLVVTESDFIAVMRDFFGLTDERLLNIVLFQLRNFDSPFNRSQLRTEMGNLITEPDFECVQRQFTAKWASNANQVFSYSYQHRSKVPLKIAVPEWAGTVHGDEIPFVFGVPLNSSKGHTDKEKMLSRKVMSLWGNFAKTGNPNGCSLLNEMWPRINANENFTTTLIIDDEMRTERNYMEKTCTFWTEIFPDILTLQGKIK